MFLYLLCFFGIIIMDIRLVGANKPKLVIKVTRQNEALRANQFFEVKVYPVQQQQEDMAGFVLSSSFQEFLSPNSISLDPSTDVPKPLAAARTMGALGLAIFNLEHPANQFEISVQKFRLTVKQAKLSGKNYLKIIPVDENPLKKETHYIEDFCERNLVINLRYGSGYSNLHYSHLSELQLLRKFTIVVVVTNSHISFGPYSYMFHLRCSDKEKNHFLFESKIGVTVETKVELYDELCESGKYELNIVIAKSEGWGCYEIMQENTTEFVQCPIPNSDENEIFYYFSYSFYNHNLICYKMDKSSYPQEQSSNGQKGKRKMFNFLSDDDPREIEATNSNINETDEESPKFVDFLATFKP